MSTRLAAVGRAQVADLDRRVAAKRVTNLAYREALSDLGWSFMPEAHYGTSTFWLTCATLPTGPTAVLDALEKADIEARPVWKPMHLQPVFAGVRSIRGSVSQRLFEQGLCLPSGSQLTAGDRARVVDVIRSVSRLSATLRRRMAGVHSCTRSSPGRFSSSGACSFFSILSTSSRVVCLSQLIGL